MYGRMIDEQAVGERYGALRDQLSASTTAGIFRSEPAFLYEISGLAESLQFRRFS
jgi:hypothetical protein